MRCEASAIASLGRPTSPNAMTYPELLQTEILKLRSIDAETAEGIQGLGKRAQDEHLREALVSIGNRARSRVGRLQDLCAERGWPERPLPSRCVEGVQHEAREELSGQPSGPVTDVLIACVAQRLVHLGIASYETALLLAADERELIRPLADSLDEVREAGGDLEWVLRSAVVPAALTASSEGRGRAARR